MKLKPGSVCNRCGHNECFCVERKADGTWKDRNIFQLIYDYYFGNWVKKHELMDASDREG